MQLQRLLIILGVLLVLALLVCCQSASKVTFQDGVSEQQAKKQGMPFYFLIYMRACKYVYKFYFIIIFLIKLHISNCKNFYIYLWKHVLYIKLYRYI